VGTGNGSANMLQHVFCVSLRIHSQATPANGSRLPPVAPPPNEFGVWEDKHVKTCWVGQRPLPAQIVDLHSGPATEAADTGGTDGLYRRWCNGSARLHGGGGGGRAASRRGR